MDIKIRTACPDCKNGKVSPALTEKEQAIEADKILKSQGAKAFVDYMYEQGRKSFCPTCGGLGVVETWVSMEEFEQILNNKK